ncbi:RNA polymerase subunit sigma-70 [Cryptosporangium sp. NPDC048952]|uniref:RNA polymerase subunit sigma-70 n=1 Tax=Cryptosporangium sp. NPDC048952 TaxID=3363961 RepID=UPI00371ABE5A
MTAARGTAAGPSATGAGAVTIDPVAPDFADLTDPYRGEILAHCYRLLGARHDAEDAVQDTYVRAWRGFTAFEGRSSIRRWLYVIATRVCLTALESRSRRPMPSGLGPPGEGPGTEPPLDLDWLEPLPDALLRHERATPESVVAAHAGIRLAFTVALQVLPARQRAALILADVLGWPASEVAEVLGTSRAGVHSALQRARARLETLGVAVDDVTEPDDAATRILLDRYADAFARADVAPLVDLLREDVVLEMPPIPTWFRGRDAVLAFLERRVLREPGRWTLTPIRSNAQPAFAVHENGAAHGVHIMTITGGRIGRITAFNDPRALAR